jgi:NDP-sugar pyrophosphorylase family protein
MVIMAGGLGSRLYPHTEKCPKALVQIAGKPMLEHIIERAKKEGFRNFIIAIYHLGEMIETHFGNGKRLGVNIEYVREKFPLGTAGALSLIHPLPSKSILVTNTDVMTEIKYGNILEFHERNNANATMAVRIHELKNPFGVVKIKGIELEYFEEKPVIRNHINAGVYVLNPETLNILKNNEHCDMSTLFQRLMVNKNRVLAYPLYENWLDVGYPTDLEIANEIL